MNCIRLFAAKTLLLVVVGFPSSGLADCTSFCFGAAGSRIFATNYDFPNELENGLIFVNQRGIAKRRWCSPTINAPKGDAKNADWVSEYGSLTFNLAGYQLVYAGMNEQGLTVSTMLLKETDTSFASGKPVLDGCFWLQFLLDTCKDVDEVVKTGGRFAVDTTQHYLVGDGHGKCAVIEFLDGKMCLHHGKSAPVAALTNSTYERSLEAWNTGIIDPSDSSTSLVRFCTAARAISKFNTSKDEPIEFAFKTLHEAKQDVTQWSIVFDIGKKQVTFKTRSHPQVRSIDLRRLDFSPQSPTKMLRVQTTLDGDITRHLFEYSHEISLAHTCDFFELYLAKQGIQWPSSDIRAFSQHTIDHFEQFGPVDSK